MVWGGGLLAHWGVLDFAGGIVVHTTAGFAALASVFYVGRRRDRESPPNSIPLIAIGTGLLWFGWCGFNAGSELDVNAITGLAFLNTDVAASFAAIVWLTIEWTVQRRPKFVGLMTARSRAWPRSRRRPALFRYPRRPSLEWLREWFAISRFI